MTITPTAEQQAAIDLFRSGDNLVIEAAAGTGKTSTLRQIADVAGDRKGLYLAFNKAIQTEAESKFSDTSVVAKTAHSLAFAEFGRPMSHKLNRSSRMRGAEKADALGLRSALMVDTGKIGDFGIKVARHVAVRVITDTVAHFCRTADIEIGVQHVTAPPTYLMNETQEAIFAHQIVPYARKYWQDIIDPKGNLPYTHDHYMKQWALSNPTLPFDYILFDEAQDADSLVSSVVKAQTHAQIVAVGDRSQAIYGWRGAIDAMDAFGGARTTLTQSFRFGHDIADFANVWLDILGADIRVRGSEKPSSVHRTEKRLPEAVLCRSNAGAIAEVLAMMSKAPERRVAIGGKGKAQQLRSLAEAAKQLQEQHWTRHPEFDTFKSWTEVVEYCEEDDGADLKPLVDLIEGHGAQFLIDAIDRTVDVAQAETTVSTAHVAKGLEWFHVRIANDFRPPKKGEDGGPGEMLPADAMLAYVASTRAQRHLDNAGLDWVFEWRRDRALHGRAAA